MYKGPLEWNPQRRRRRRRRRRTIRAPLGVRLGGSWRLDEGQGQGPRLEAALYLGSFKNKEFERTNPTLGTFDDKKLIATMMKNQTKVIPPPP